MSDDDTTIILVAAALILILIIGVASYNPKQLEEAHELTTYFGLSGYPRTLAGAYSTDVIDDIITVMDNEGLNGYRMSIWYTESDATRDAMVNHFLTNCNYHLTVCYHDYPPATENDAYYTAAQVWAIDLLDTFPAYDTRLDVEIVNERLNSALHTRTQAIVTAIRAAGHTNGIVCNRHTQQTVESSSLAQMATVSDPEDEFYTGEHYYFKSGAWSSAESRMQAALNSGAKLACTEIGADYDEKNEFDGYEVARVSEFMAWCYTKDISCYVWMNRGLDNWAKYQQLGLVFPPTELPSDPEPPEPPPIQYYYVNVSANANGQTSPSGLITKQVGTSFTAVATADTDYLFDYWTRNGTEVTPHNATYTMTDGYANSTYTLVAYFVANPPTEPDDPPVPDPAYYSVNIGTSTGGTTDLVGIQTLLLGETLTVNATPKPNYRFCYWLYNNVASLHGNTEFNVTVLSTGRHTLLPVFQLIPPPPPDTPISPAATNMAIVENSYLHKILKQTTRIEKIDINDIFKKLGATKF